MDDWDTELDYAIVNHMKVFMGENEGRKLFFDTFASSTYSMQTLETYEDNNPIRARSLAKFKEFMKAEEKSWNREKTLLLVVSHKQHYTGIRVETNGNVTIFDPNYDNKLYSPLPKTYKNFLKKIFKGELNEYQLTCQITQDQADSFCQTWSMYLLTHPDFVPPKNIRDRFAIILNVYKTILQSVDGKKRYRKFLGDLNLPFIESTGKTLTKKQCLSLVNMSLDRFVKSMYWTMDDYKSRGFQYQYKLLF